MKLPEILQSSDRYHSDEQIIRMTADQLIKDMGEFSFSITFQGNLSSPYQELFEQVQPIIYTLEMMQPEKLRALLYRIDISENEIKKHLLSVNPETASTKTDLSSFVTDLVLKRELKKVLTRIYFSTPERLG